MALRPEALAWLADLWTPVVMVMASPELDELSKRSNGLRFADILKPFGRIQNLNGDAGVPIRTVAEHSLRLLSWRIRFVASDGMAQVPADQADGKLRALLREAAEALPKAEPRGVEELLDDSGRGDPTPWFTAYRDAFVRLQAFGDHESMDHPVACLLALPSSIEGDYAQAFEQLYRTAPHPPLLDAGVMDQRLLRYYSIVHNPHLDRPEDLERAEMALPALASRLGSTCNLLVLGHGDGRTTAVSQAFWQQDALTEADRTQVALATGLGERDVAELSEFVRETAVRSLIPMLEGKIRALNHQVSLSRKGLKNQLKSLLWRKAGSGTEGSNDPGNLTPLGGALAGGAAAATPAPLHQFPATSLVAEMRQLADLALMVGDHETALGTLKLVAADFRAERAHRHYAAALEAIGVATALSGGSAADAAAPIKDAFYRYSQLLTPGPAGAPTTTTTAISALRVRESTRSATRAALLAMLILRSGGAVGDAGYVAMKAHFQEDNLRAGLLLEQAAHCLLARDPPQARKFAFHLVLAALRYKLSDQLVLARRTYKQVLGVYSGRGWSFVEEHLHDALGKYARDHGDVEAACAHVAAMLDCPHESAFAQATCLTQLREVVAAYRSTRGEDPHLELPVPHVGRATAVLHADERVCTGTAATASVAASVWRVLEDATEPQLQPGSLVTWLDAPGASNADKTLGLRRAVVGEKVQVDVLLTNPLDIELHISGLALDCAFEGEDNAADSSAFVVDESNALLVGRQHETVALTVTALRPGTLHINAVRWELSGDVHGLVRLAVPGPRPRKPNGTVRLDAPRPPPGGFTLRVLPASPRVEVELRGLRPRLLAGELGLCCVIIRNASAVPVRGLRLASTSPVHLTERGGAARDLPAGPATDCRWNVRTGVTTFSLAGGRVLLPGRSLEIDVVFWSQTPGEAVFNLLTAYEADRDAPGIRWRCTRSAWPVTVLPSVALRLTAMPETIDPRARLLQLDLRGLQNEETIVIGGLESVDGPWRLWQLGNIAEAKSPPALGATLAPRAMFSCHCLLANEGEGEDGHGLELLRQFQRDASGRFLWDRAAPPAIPSCPTGRDPPLSLLLRWIVPAAEGTAERVGYRALVDRALEAGPPLRVQLLGPPPREHDFSTPALANLTLRICNTMDEETTVVVEAGDVSGSSDSGLGPLPHSWSVDHGGVDVGDPLGLSLRPLSPAGQYIWVGRMRQTLPSVAAHTVVELPLAVAVLAPGVVRVGDYSVSCQLPGRAPTRLRGAPCLLELAALTPSPGTSPAP